MPEDLDAIKRQVAELAKQKNKRIIGSYPSDPSRWYPTTVIDPRTGSPFTDAGAWDYIAEEVVKNKNTLREVFLKAPIGKPGYELFIKEYKAVYIKVRMANGKIIGRSFHYSTPATNEDE